MYGRGGSDTFRQLLSDPDTPFSDVITSDFFLGLWSTGDSQLVNYVVSHFDQFLNLAFQISGPSPRLIIQRCSRLLDSGTSEVRDRLVSETNLVEFVQNFIPKIEEFSTISHRVYFALLPEILFDTMGAIFPEFESESYFVGLFSVVHVPPAYAFLDDLIGSASRSVRLMFKRIRLSAVLLDKMLLDNPLLRQKSQSLFMQALSSDVAFGLPDSLMENGRLFLLMDADLYKSLSLHFGDLCWFMPQRSRMENWNISLNCIQ
jgi:hypothetical protein